MDRGEDLADSLGYRGVLGVGLRSHIPFKGRVLTSKMIDSMKCIHPSQNVAGIKVKGE